MYSSNYNSFFYSHNHTAIYNSLTGQFVILHGIILKDQFEGLIKRTNAQGDKGVDILYQKGLVHREQLSKKSELAQYQAYYVICNNTIFYHIEDGSAVISVPGMGGKHYT